MSECTPMMAGFRSRLVRLIHEQCEGKYTRLARRAGIPTSTMQSFIHSAKHLPGGEQLLRLAEALGVSLDYLATGQEVARPAELLAHPVVFTSGLTPPLGNATTVAIPLFRCGCPDACPLTEPVPPVAAAWSEAIFPATLLARYEHHRLLAIQVGQGLASPEWPEGTQLVVDWEARTPRWAAVSLLHTDTRCRLGHVVQSGERWIFADRVAATPELLLLDAIILGTIVALMMPT